MDHSLAHLESWAQLEPQLLETRRCSMIPLGIYSHSTNPLEASTKILLSNFQNLYLQMSSKENCQALQGAYHVLYIVKCPTWSNLIQTAGV